MNTPYYSTTDAEKYHSIFSSIDEGFVISELLYDDSGKAYDLMVLEANRRFHEMLAISDSVGKRAKEIFPGVDDSWFEQYHQVIATGKAFRFENYLAERNKWFELYLSRVGDDGSKVFVIVFNDITERKKQQERQDYLLKLSDALQFLADPAEIQSAATRVLGEQLNASNCFYSEVEADGEHSVITNGYHRGEVNLDGRHRMESFGKSWIDSVRAGHTTICTDVLIDKRITTEERDMTLSIGVRSHANVPLVKNGRFVAKLTVTDSKPRAWSNEEIVLIKETAERTWAALEKARAEKALRESEEKYRMLFNSIDEGFNIIEIIFDDQRMPVDIRLLEANPTFEKMTGLSRDVVGKRVREFMPTIDQSVIDRYGNVALSGEAMRFEEYVRELDAWFDVYACRFGDKSSPFVIVVYKNITERKRTEEWQAYLLRLSDAIRPLADPDEIQRMAMRVLVEQLGVNRAYFYETFPEIDEVHMGSGYSTPELEEWPNRHRFSDYGDHILKAFERGETIVFNDGQDGSQPESVRTTFRAVETRAAIGVPLVKGGRLVSVLAVHQLAPRKWKREEIHLVQETAERTWAAVERARAEKAFREEQHKLNLAQQAGQVGVWTLDPQSGTGTATSVWSWITAYSSWSDQGKWDLDQLMESFHPEDRPKIMESLENAYRHSKEIDVEFRLHHPVLGDRWMLMRGSRMWSMNGKDNSLMGTIIDITDRKAAEEQKEQFLGIASHELKTPVTAIMAYGELLEEMFAKEGMKKPAGLMNKMNGQLNKLVKLIEDLLDITRITGGSLKLEADDFDLSQLLREHIEEMQLTTSHTLTLDSCSEMLVHADRVRIGQVINNLLSNAIKYSKELSKVEISCKEDGDMAVVSVSDSGIGMTEHTKRTIFGRFARANDKTVNYIPGLGLGLYVANEIIKHHGGRMWVESEPGVGSTFYFSIPRGPRSNPANQS